MTGVPILIRLRSRIARARVLAARQFGKLVQFLTTIRARSRLARSGPIEVLVDTAILASAVAHETAWISTGLAPWGEVQVDTGYMARVPVKRRPEKGAKDDEVRDFRDSSYLTGIAYLARRGLIRLRSSGELLTEQWQQPVGRLRGNTIYSRSLFDGIKIEPIDGMPDMVIGPSWMGFPSLKEQQQRRLDKAKASDKLYEEILKRLGPKSSQDAWHVRTAEVHRMYCLLTTDYKLMRTLDAQSKLEPIKSLQTKVLSPTDLGRALGLWPLNPKYVSHEGDRVPVRADRSLPGNKRRSRAQKKR